MVINLANHGKGSLQQYYGITARKVLPVSSHMNMLVILTHLHMMSRELPYGDCGYVVTCSHIPMDIITV